MSSQLTHGQNAHRERELLRELDAQAQERHPVGTSLTNEAVVIAAKASGGGYDCVLALVLEHGQFAIWKIDPETGNCFWGEYYEEIQGALDRFNERV